MATAFFDTPPPAGARRPLTEDDAVNIWIARWLRVRPKELVRRYACDPRRLYEIWEETRFPGTRATALKLLAERYPGVEARIDPGPHRRIAIEVDPPAADAVSRGGNGPLTATITFWLPVQPSDGTPVSDQFQGLRRKLEPNKNIFRTSTRQAP